MKQPETCVYIDHHEYDKHLSKRELIDNLPDYGCKQISEIGSDFCINHRDGHIIQQLEQRERELNERVSSLVTKVVGYQDKLQEEQFIIDQLICEIDERNSLSIYEKFKYFIKTRIERW